MKRHHFGTPLSFTYEGSRTYLCRLSDWVFISIEYRTDSPTGWWIFGVTAPNGEYAGTSIDHAAQKAASDLANLLDRWSPS